MCQAQGLCALFSSWETGNGSPNLISPLVHLPLSLTMLRQIPAYVLVLLFIYVARSGATEESTQKNKSKGLITKAEMALFG